MIDVDSFKIFNDTSIISNTKDEIDLIHNIEKNLFFTLLSKNFMETLKPQYGE